ncbi:hypothetical protein M758_3G116000 [Ceratodon purpureus]|nr:hypothetical protein M758_3G116000 [Ceratodon purpureus]
MIIKHKDPSQARCPTHNPHPTLSTSIMKSMRHEPASSTAQSAVTHGKFYNNNNNTRDNKIAKLDGQETRSQGANRMRRRMGRMGSRRFRSPWLPVKNLT